MWGITRAHDRDLCGTRLGQAELRLRTAAVRSRLISQDKSKVLKRLYQEFYTSVNVGNYKRNPGI